MMTLSKEFIEKLQKWEESSKITQTAEDKFFQVKATEIIFNGNKEERKALFDTCHRILDGSNIREDSVEHVCLVGGDYADYLKQKQQTEFADVKELADLMNHIENHDKLRDETRLCEYFHEARESYVEVLKNNPETTMMLYKDYFSDLSSPKTDFMKDVFENIAFESLDIDSLKELKRALNSDEFSYNLTSDTHFRIKHDRDRPLININLAILNNEPDNEDARQDAWQIIKEDYVEGWPYYDYYNFNVEAHIEDIQKLAKVSINHPTMLNDIIEFLNDEKYGNGGEDCDFYMNTEAVESLIQFVSEIESQNKQAIIENNSQEEFHKRLDKVQERQDVLAERTGQKTSSPSEPTKHDSNYSGSLGPNGRGGR